MTQKFRSDYVKGVVQLQLQTNSLNTLKIDDLEELGRLIRDAGKNPEVRSIVLTSSSSEVFSYGLDPKHLLEKAPMARLEVFQELGRMVRAFTECPVPIIGDVKGAAIAGGAVVAFCCDFLLLGTAAKICFSETKVGLPVPLFVQKMIQRKVSGPLALEMAMLGKNVSADRALEAGLAHAVYGNDEDRLQNLTSLTGRIQRLQRAVVAETLLVERNGLLADIDAFLKAAGNFAHFLTDEYLGQGLKALLTQPV